MTTLTRRRGTAFLAALVGTALALTACTAADSDPNENAAIADTDATFPATVETAYGEITVNEKPERIVAIPGAGYVDLLDALGETPVAWNFGLQETTAEVLEFAPWLEGAIDSDPVPDLFNADFTLNVEAIAAWEPDLILTTIWVADESTYQQLSAIAPTYVGIETETQTSWADDFAAIARLTGHDPAIVGETESELTADFAGVADRLPGLQGKTFMVAATDDDAVFWLCDYGNLAIEGLGLVPHELQPDGEGCTPGGYSWERLDEFTADVVFFVTEHRDPSGETQARLEADPRLAELPAADNGTIVHFSPAEPWSAINGGTPASYRWWLQQDFISQLEASALNQSGQ